jgi:hypothetical protein
MTGGSGKAGLGPSTLPLSLVNSEIDNGPSCSAVGSGGVGADDSEPPASELGRDVGADRAETLETAMLQIDSRLGLRE